MSILKHAKKSMVLAVLAGLVFAAAPSDAFAQARPTPVKHSSSPAAGKVSLQMKVVHANNSGKVDARLKRVVENLKFTRFNGFALLNTHKRAFNNDDRIVDQHTKRNYERAK